MAGKRKKVLPKNYDALIYEKKKELEQLESDKSAIAVKMKELKADIKKLEKEKNRFKEQEAIRIKEEETKKIAEMIVESGKSLEDVKKLLDDNATIKTAK